MIRGGRGDNRQMIRGGRGDNRQMACGGRRSLNWFKKSEEYAAAADPIVCEWGDHQMATSNTPAPSRGTFSAVCHAKYCGCWSLDLAVGWFCREWCSAVFEHEHIGKVFDVAV